MARSARLSGPARPCRRPITRLTVGAVGGEPGAATNDGLPVFGRKPGTCDDKRSGSRRPRCGRAACSGQPTAGHFPARSALFPAISDPPNMLTKINVPHRVGHRAVHSGLVRSCLPSGRRRGRSSRSQEISSAIGRGSGRIGIGRSCASRMMVLGSMPS